MARPSTPARIDIARHEATRQRLMGEGVPAATADSWLAAWEAQAARDAIERGSAYWQAGWAWIVAERLKRARPTK